jgi:hypothetical protein
MITYHIVATVTTDHIITRSSVTVVVFGATLAFVIPFVAMLKSKPVTQSEEHAWNSNVL